jgi:hypothetical protein
MGFLHSAGREELTLLGKAQDLAHARPAMPASVREIRSRT